MEKLWDYGKTTVLWKQMAHGPRHSPEKLVARTINTFAQSYDHIITLFGEQT